MVGVSLRHSSGSLSSRTECQPCFRCAESSHPSPSYRREDGARTLLAPTLIRKSGLEIRLTSRRAAQVRRIGGSRDAWVLEISVGVGRAEHIYAAVARRSSIREAEFKTRAVGNGEFERGSEERILTKDRREEDGDEEGGSRGSADENGERPAGEGDAGDVVAAASKAASMAAEILNEGFEGEGNAEASQDGRNGLLDERFLRRVAAAESADAVLGLIAERLPERGGGVVGTEECSQMILAAIAQHNVELAFSILNSMRSSLLQRRIDRQEGVPAQYCCF